MVLRDYQKEAVEFLSPRERGFVQAPAGAGKTMIGAAALARAVQPGWRVVWVGNTREQVEQACAAIGRTQGPEGVEFEVCCAAAQPDTSKADVLVFDEAHHVPAVTWSALTEHLKPSCRVWGLSATPFGEDEERNEQVRSIFREFFTIARERVEASGHLSKGKVFIHAIDTPEEFDEAIDKATEEEASRRLKKFPMLMDVPRALAELQKTKSLVNVLRERRGQNFVAAVSRGLVDISKEDEATRDLVGKIQAHDAERARLVKAEHASRARWQLTQECLQANSRRNEKAVSLILDEAQNGESVLVLVASIEHGETLVSRIPGSAVVHSKLPAKERRRLIEAFRSGELRVLVSTSLADEGLDVPRASRLVLVCGGRSAGKLEQRAGRILRPFEGKSCGIVHDFLDEGACLALAQARARLRVYDRLGYEPEVVRYAA